MHDKLWGSNQFVVLATVRYCLGRQTYIVGECARWLIANWADIEPQMKTLIERDVEDEFRRDDEARSRAREGEHKPLGWDCDRKEWERVRELWTPRG
jgi:hypothetical protein